MKREREKKKEEKKIRRKWIRVKGEAGQRGKRSKENRGKLN